MENVVKQEGRRGAARKRRPRHPHVRTDTSTHGTLGRTNGTTYCRSRQTNKQMAREGGFARDGRRERLRKLPTLRRGAFPHSELSECGISGEPLRTLRVRTETFQGGNASSVGSRASRCGGCLLVLSYSSAVNLSEGDLHSTLPLLVVETAFGESEKGGVVPREATRPD